MGNHRFQEGRAWLNVCPLVRCERPVIEAHVDGLTLRLDTKAIPFKDAVVIDKYDGIVVNVWKGPTQLWAVAWFRDQGRVDKGHLYVQHRHGAHK